MTIRIFALDPLFVSPASSTSVNFVVLFHPKSFKIKINKNINVTNKFINRKTAYVNDNWFEIYDLPSRPIFLQRFGESYVTYFVKYLVRVHVHLYVLTNRAYPLKKTSKN